MLTLAEPTTVAITLEITQADIVAGVAGDCGVCPIAIAFRRACPGAAKVSVGRKYITFWTMDGKRHDIRMPYGAQDFVQTVDNGPKDPSPFYFSLPLPTHLVNTPGFLADESEWAPVDASGRCPG